MASMKLFGDWSKIPQVGTLAKRFQTAVAQSLLKEGHLLRGKVVAGIASGAPGGKPFAPLSPITLALRSAQGFGGNKPLNVTGALRGGIVVHRTGSGTNTQVFVGLLRQAAAKNGKSLANIGAIHEFGKTWTQTMTKKSRAWFFVMLAKAGFKGQKPGVSKNTGGQITIRIPARPFLAPVFDAERPAIAKRFWENVARGVGGDLGKPK